MPLGPYHDRRADPEAWARALGISREAIELYLASEVIDLHVDTFIWTRVLGYDLTRRHGAGFFGARYFGMADLPRVREAAIGGAMWSITTSPFGSPTARAERFGRNLARLRAVLESVPDEVDLVTNLHQYRAARAAGRHAAMIAIQGGNALDAGPAALERLVDDLVLRVTLVHLTHSAFGGSSAPGGGSASGLTARGREFVEHLNARRIFVDLAHASRQSFFDALEVHDRTQPLLVTHTGVSAVHPSWRNLDDAQLRAIADTGGTVGVVFHGGYLGGSYLMGGSLRLIVDHLEHIVRTVGEDHASLGSDWDGAIITPRDMPTCLELPRLVQGMLDRGFSPDCIAKILGGNFLRTLRQLRG
jgi:membrane dipeptidase